MNYKSKQWEHKRSRILRRDGYRCQLSKRIGKRIEGNTVHHIFPASLFPEWALEDWNLITVSAAMHNKLHDRGGDLLTAEGLEVMRRAARKKNINADIYFQRLEETNKNF